jgi:hypothetical protein
MKSAHRSTVGRALPAMVFRIATGRSGGQCPPYGNGRRGGAWRSGTARGAARCGRVVGNCHKERG